MDNEAHPITLYRRHTNVMASQIVGNSNVVQKYVRLTTKKTSKFRMSVTFQLFPLKIPLLIPGHLTSDHTVTYFKFNVDLAQLYQLKSPGKYTKLKSKPVGLLLVRHALFTLQWYFSTGMDNMF